MDRRKLRVLEAAIEYGEKIAARRGTVESSDPRGRSLDRLRELERLANEYPQATLDELLTLAAHRRPNPR